MGIRALCSVLFVAHSLLQLCVVGARVIQPSSETTGQGRGREFVPNPRPLIGVLTQPFHGDGWMITSKSNDPEHTNTSYVAASYVKFVESGGARVVPLIYNEPEEILKKKFDAINGILLPGGGASLDDGPFYRASKKLFDWALEANDNGDYFPIYGVCLGFELLAVLVTEDHNVLEPFTADKRAAPLIFVDEAATEKSFFKWLPNDLVQNGAVEDVALENHGWGLSPLKFGDDKPLSDFFEVLTITPDDYGEVYVSTVQAWNYPIFAVQYHPEKNVFEWGYNTIPHSSAATRFTQSVALFLISEARKSQHSPSSEKEEQEFLIYNNDPVYSGKRGNASFDQIYVFY